MHKYMSSIKLYRYVCNYPLGLYGAPKSDIMSISEHLTAPDSIARTSLREGLGREMSVTDRFNLYNQFR